MSGSSLPYHLRIRKAIDRSAFIDVLRHLGRKLPISDYHYLGFGGNSFEDFKQLHTQLGIERMISLEKDINAYNRQNYNRPMQCITMIQQSSDEYLAEFQSAREESKNYIVWLDYTSAAALPEQLLDIKSVVLAAEHGDVLKITLNAYPAALSRYSKATGIALQKERLEALRERIGSEPTSGLRPEDMENASYPATLCKILRYSIGEAMNDKPDLRFEYLSAFSYSDRQQMLTVSGVFLDKQEDPQKFMDATGISKWNLYSKDWKKPIIIDIPDLTLRERIEIDKMLPGATPASIRDAVGFYFGESERESNHLLESYLLFYRYVMHYSRVAI